MSRRNSFITWRGPGTEADDHGGQNRYPAGFEIPVELFELPALKLSVA